MAWPMSQDYNEAIQNAAHCFADPDLQRGEVVTSELGLPIPCSGNFADVYAVVAGAHKWAIKCFTREIPGLKERYAAVSQYLQRQSSCLSWSIFAFWSRASGSAGSGTRS